MEEKKKEELEELNDLIFDPSLSVEELEERLEFDSWGICSDVLCPNNCPRWA